MNHAKVKCKCMCLLSDIPVSSADFTIYILGIGILFCTVSSHLGKFSAFSAANGIHNSTIFVPPGTHHCWVGKGSME